MNRSTKMNTKKCSPYKASITRQQFLFYEMRITAKLLSDGLPDQQVIERIFSENLFQYPTEKSLRRTSQGCIARLKSMQSNSLIEAIATQPSNVAKQICLYAMMKENRLVWDFMIEVIGEKYRSKDNSFGRIDMNTFFMRLQEQDDSVASWSESTIAKIKQVLKKIMMENEYIDNNKSEKLNLVLISPALENAIRRNQDEIALPAFNCFT